MRARKGMARQEGGGETYPGLAATQFGQMPWAGLEECSARGCKPS